MSYSRRHGWSKGPTKVLFEALKYTVVYRARKIEGSGVFGEWQKGKISMVVQPSAEDPEGRKALEKRIRFAREKNMIEMEVHEIFLEGDEVALPGTSDGKPVVVSNNDYEGLKRKSNLVYPGHPSWEKSKLVH